MKRMIVSSRNMSTRYRQNVIATLDDISNIDIEAIDTYSPSDQIIKKLMDYRAKGSKVNVKAIKDTHKLLTYYYTAKLIGWSELAYAIRDAAPRGYWRVFDNIDQQVHADANYRDARSEDDIALGLADSNGLLTFDQRRRRGQPDCWLPKSILQYFVDNNIPVHFGKRTSGSGWDRNGAQWSEVEHLTLFPGTADALNYWIVVHTNERADGSIPNTYTSSDAGERVSAKRIIEGLDQRLRREGLI